ncbi:MAG: hypothetical protein ACOC16_00340 [Nanoarchaeota archaeon]
MTKKTMLELIKDENKDLSSTPFEKIIFNYLYKLFKYLCLAASLIFILTSMFLFYDRFYIQGILFIFISIICILLFKYY